MRFVIALWCLGELAAGQQLRVKSATARSVQLEWDGAAAPVTVERATGSAFQKLASASQASYEDKTIDPFATYRYRVSAGGKSSNEVIVGPPPAGILNAAPVPKGTEPPKYGTASAIALDENGDPIVAFEWLDPNGDANNSDSDIRFVRWDRTARKWLPPVQTQVVGDIQAQNRHPVSIACDRKTGLLAIITPVVDKGASVLISKDRGATWSATPISGVGPTVTSTAMAIADGTAHVALTSSESGAFYLTGPIENISGWKREPVPSDSGWKPRLDVNVGLVMDGSGNPLIAWYEEQDGGDGRRFEVWKPGGKAAIAVETNTHTDSPDLAIATGGGKIGLLFETPLDEKDEDHGVWYTQSADGSSWSKPVKLPIDGPRTTNPPLDIAIDSRSRIAAVLSANSGSDTTTCNYPVLSRSSDGTSWKTCGPGKAEGGDFSPQPANLHVIEAGNDKAYIVWQEQSDNKFHEGMLLWHEH